MSSTDITQQQQPNILHPATSIVALEQNGARLMNDAKGIHIKDQEGNQLIDGIAGLWCSNIGHGRTEIAETLSNAARSLDYFHTFNGHTNQAQEELAARLVAMAPENLTHVFFGCSGSDANDTLVKIAWQYHIMRGKPEKRKIISRWQAYHGTSISTASLTGLKGFHRSFNLPLDFAVHTECPFYYAEAKSDESAEAYTARLHTQLRELIAREGAENIAAFIGEPIMGAGGVITPPEGYWKGVESICRENDILLIADEVVCGFGRTGKNFGVEHYEIQPDLMATAKGLTAGVFPMSAAFVSTDVHDVLRQASAELGGFSHGYTYSGHPIGAAVANKVLDIMANENLVDNAAAVGAYLHEKLNASLAGHPNVGEIRGKGLLAAIQLMDDAPNKRFLDPKHKMAARVSEACYRYGLIIRPLPSINSLALSPPLVLSKAEADQIVEKVILGLEEIFH
ncbi:aspartate aminotransferase family protein [Aliikangiella coralliicola]|uniref:Aminotransferase class III-fold pyridoxal phosphate-dependent enzyme n=1 Tax=Aliikangiella coralliicola TaxID=2592383 RepID=A0A545UG77_9GAMM|nr:aminotransferase [Aliikangiella coralliicola]TQV88471.1 aminotransferase class III-fold pyridoxal phosphate-dependent enzyme [Aliikangiella coralliicola]